MRRSIQTIALLLSVTAVPASADDLSCLQANAPVTVTYEGMDYTAHDTVKAIYPGYCIAIWYSGGVIYTTPNEAGGVSCNGSVVEVDYNKASIAFNGYSLKDFPPAACGPAQACPPVETASPGESIFVYYGQDDRNPEMVTVTVRGVSASCYEVSYSGQLWFPLSALHRRCNLLGAPLAFSYNDRSNSRC